MGKEEEISFIHDLMNKMTIVDGKLKRLERKLSDPELKSDLEKAIRASNEVIEITRTRRKTLD